MLSRAIIFKYKILISLENFLTKVFCLQPQIIFIIKLRLAFS